MSPHLPNQIAAKGLKMKKVTTTRWSFWNWLLGGGNAGAGGGA
jgi:hypothetical protein